jgi:hypothetical protein
VIKHVVSCPYCRKGEIAFDCESMDLVINPDGAVQEPCEHLLCLDGFYCRARVLAGGGRQAGFAKVHWQHPGLEALGTEEIQRRLEQRAASEAQSDLAPGTEDCTLTFIGWKEEEHPSEAEIARWLDQVGWDKAEELEIPSLEYRLDGWVGFARCPAELLPRLVEGQVPLAG